MFATCSDHATSGRRWALLGLAQLVCGLMVAGCAKPPAPVVSQVSLRLEAAADANPDVRKRASPVTVRVYALKSAAAFEAADFFSLYDKDSATLGADLLQKEELLLRPGESKTLDLTLSSEAKALAVMAAFRDLEHARWRQVHVLDVGQPVQVNVRLQGSRLALTAHSMPGASKK